MHLLMQGLQHQSVAAKRHHDIGLGGIVIAVKRYQFRQRLLGLTPALATKAIRLYRLGWSWDCGLVLALMEKGAEVVYTTLAILVEMTEPHFQAANAIGNALRRQPDTIL